MKIQAELDEEVLRKMVLQFFRDKLGSIPLSEKDIHIEVKSKQNYRSEWEEASFRARVDFSQTRTDLRKGLT